MVTWEQRFEDLIFEINELESPSDIRHRELEKVVHSQLYEDIQDMRNQIMSTGFTPSTIWMPRELWYQLTSDPLFGESTNEKL